MFKKNLLNQSKIGVPPHHPFSNPKKERNVSNRSTFKISYADDPPASPDYNIKQQSPSIKLSTNLNNYFNNAKKMSLADLNKSSTGKTMCYIGASNSTTMLVDSTKHCRSLK